MHLQKGGEGGPHLRFNFIIKIYKSPSKYPFIAEAICNRIRFFKRYGWVFALLHACVPIVYLVPVGVRRGSWIPGAGVTGVTDSCKLWVLEIKPMFSARAASTLNH